MLLLTLLLLLVLVVAVAPVVMGPKGKRDFGHSFLRLDRC